MTPQRKANSPRILEVRSLTEADLEYLRQPSAKDRLLKIKDSHHNVARLLASGLNLGEVAEATGYSLVRISILSKDPSVQDLVAHYRAMITEEWREAHDELQRSIVQNATKAERMIGDRLDEADANGETLPMRELIALTSDRYDRIGYGKKNMNLNVNVDFAAKLEAAINRTKKVAAE